MTDDRYSWTTFYSEFADRLLEFKDNRQELISCLQNVYTTIGMKFPRLDTNVVPKDIDPFTIFGLFNKGISEVNRKKIATELSSKFSVKAPIPNNFDGIPTLNNLNATFYAFYDDDRRGIHDIDNIWNVFESGIAYSDNPTNQNRTNFIKAYDKARGQFGLGWRITIGLYWIRPYSFISLDSRNRWYLEYQENAPENIIANIKELKTPPDGASYLDLRDKIFEAMKSGDFAYKTLPDLSMNAFKESEKINQQNKEREQAAQDNALGDADVETIHYWLYAPGEKASKWDDFYERGVMGLGWHELGDLRNYPSKEDMRLKLQEINGNETSQSNSAHAVWQFANYIKPGDVVFAKRGRSEILGRGKIEGDYEYDADGGEYPNIRKVRWTDKGKWPLDMMFALKTLTEVTDYPDFISKVEAFFEKDEAVIECEERDVELPDYTAEDFLSEVYMDEERYAMLTSVLAHKKNVILQGAPGVGKTFVAKRLAYSIMGKKDIERVMMVQFHQSYSYEDFIEGYRPSDNGFELVKGAFYNFCKKAQDDTENKYFFIIDEINRGNLSKIFGELFMLIENDKRGSKNKLQLLYSRELFYVPGNVYIIGMMNTADRSLAMLDYALRRRFAFFDILPAFPSVAFRTYREKLGSAKLDALVQRIEQLNDEIARDESLGEGFCIGHSYFCGMDANDCNYSKLSALVDFEIVLLLKEYWFDDPARVRDWSDRLKDAIL